MSALRIVWPLEDVADRDIAGDQPDVVPFRRVSRTQTRQQDVVERARTFYRNRRCATCGYPVVTPIELDDALINKCGQKIPGSATLVGFRCCGCHAEWLA
jgi:hypothetical protein